MAGRVIQGFFLGGQFRPRHGTPHAAAAQPKAAASPPPRAGPPPSAFSGRALAAQPQGGTGSFAVDPVQLGLARSGGTTLPAPLLAKMEAAFGADFSGVRVHVGPQAARIGAIAFTTGDDLYFAPGRYQPDSVQGQQLIGHELAHVIQQRQGRVRAPGGGVAIVQDQMLEAEADRLGMRAAMHAGPVPPRAPSPSVAGPQSSIQRARNRAMVPVRGPSAPPPAHQRRLEATRARLRSKVTPEKFPEITRPTKPKSLSREHPQTGEALTFHHKLNCEKLLEALRKAIRDRDTELLEKLRVFARYQKFTKDFRDRVFGIKPSTVHFAKEFRKFQKALVWSAWNGYFSYIPEKRIDDPKHDLDSHYRSDGSRTPRTELAHAIGPNFALDLAELGRRLAALPSANATEFVTDEWPTIGNIAYQRHDPRPALRIMDPNFAQATPRTFVISIAANDATKRVRVDVTGGNDRPKAALARKIGNLWKVRASGLQPAGNYTLKISAYSDVNGNGVPLEVEAVFRVDSRLTESERATLVAERKKPKDDVKEEPDYGFQLFE